MQLTSGHLSSRNTARRIDVVTFQLAVTALLLAAALPLAGQPGTPPQPGHNSPGGIETTTVGGGGADVAVLAYCSDLTGAFGAEHAVDTLVADGRFNTVTLIDGDVVLPTAQDLLDNYSCVLAATDNRCGDESSSDAIAGFVQGGGGLVLASFGLQTGIGFNGPIFDPGLSPFQPGPGNGAAGPIDVAGASTAPPCDLLMAGVTAPLSSQFSSEVDLSADGQLCTSYDNGDEMLAVNPDISVVGYNSFPFSEMDNMQASYRLMLGNSMALVCAPPEPPTPVVEVPAMSATGAALLAILLIGLGLFFLRHRAA